MIDANIFNSSVRPAEDPVQQYNRLAQLAGLRQEQQLNKLRIDEGNIKLKQMNQGVADDEAVRGAAAGAIVNGQLDRNKFLQNLSSVAPHRVAEFQSKFATQDAAQNKSLADIGKTKSETNKLDIEAAGKKLDIIGSTANGILSVPPEQQQAAYSQGLAALHQQGIDTSTMPQQFDAGLVSRYRDMALSAKEQIAAHQAQSTAAETLRHNKATEGLTQRGQDLTNDRAKEANKNAIGVPFEQLPPDEKALVHQIGQGKMTMGNLDRILTKNPGLMATVSQVYPDFDQSKIKGYSQAYRDFTGAGKLSTQLNAGSTALRHLAELKKINDENPVAVHNAATAAYKRYHNLLDTVTDELVTFYGEPKTNQVIESKKSTLGGFLNRGAAIEEQAKAMGAKFDELENTWQNAAPSKAYQAAMPGYSDAAKQARATLDPEYAARQQGGSFSVTDPNGGVHTFKTQAEADNFKKAISK